MESKLFWDSYRQNLKRAASLSLPVGGATPSAHLESVARTEPGFHLLRLLRVLESAAVTIPSQTTGLPRQKRL